MYKISGVITTYNRSEKIVERAIKSMLLQTYPLFEIIVIDDNANDNPLCKRIKAICHKYNKIKYIKQNGNKGACAARNLGISNSEGEFVGFLDDDDEWLPDKIAYQIKMFEKADFSVGLVSVSGYKIFEKTGETTNYSNYFCFKRYPTFDDMLALDWVGSTSQPLIKAECFRKVGMFSEEQPARQDYEMWIRISKQYNIICSKKRLFIHRMHNQNQISKDPNKGCEGLKNIYNWYKKDYKKNPYAENKIAERIIDSRGKQKRVYMAKYYFIKYFYLLKWYTHKFL